MQIFTIQNFQLCRSFKLIRKSHSTRTNISYKNKELGFSSRILYNLFVQYAEKCR
ncbi:hypothetical protein MANES_01G203450v8 [Manihot esculenta]|uniref:Uncharacterized protein n=1 Tax=Manihot esculenta TaxID=3983 RepID=A0ACB7IH23_MANES|nr:hypothetical protein MANES_01G203450v8 [Manihot esculenta]